MDEPLNFVSGAPRNILRIEALLLFGIAIWLYSTAHLSWPLFALLFLTPDIFMLGYLLNTKVGALLYNVAHTSLTYAPLAALGWQSGNSVLLSVGLIGLAHVGFDRAVGYGLKYPTAFGDTHLGRVGKNNA